MIALENDIGHDNDDGEQVIAFIAFGVPVAVSPASPCHGADRPVMVAKGVTVVVVVAVSSSPALPATMSIRRRLRHLHCLHRSRN